MSHQGQTVLAWIEMKSRFKDNIRLIWTENKLMQSSTYAYNQRISRKDHVILQWHSFVPVRLENEDLRKINKSKQISARYAE